MSGKLLHPNIVRAFDAGEIDGRPFIVLELIRGFDLRECVRASGPLPIGDVCEIVIQIAAALGHLSEHAMVHRDIKPANLMLTSAGHVKLLDVGLARSTRYEDDDQCELTLTGDLLGTTDFMSPEQINGIRELGIETDIYGLGATAYYLLTAQHPFPTDRFDKPSEKLNAIVEGNMVPLSTLRNDLPSDLESIIQRMIARDPNERYNDPTELANQIKAYCHSSNLRRLFKTVAATEARTGGARGIGRRRVTFVMMVAFASALIGFAMLVSWRHRDKATAELHAMPTRNQIEPIDPSPTEILLSPQWRWSEPEPIRFRGFEKLVTPSLTSDELTLVFGSYQRLYISTRESIAEPFNYPSEIELNLDPTKCESPAISGDGLNLVCSFWMGDDQDDDANLYLFRRETIDQEFQPPELIRSVALPERQNGAWLAADGCTLVFTSFHQSQRGIQMVTTRRSNQDPFEHPNTISMVATPNREAEPCLTSDGKTCVTTLLGGDLPQRRQLVRRTWDPERSVFAPPVPLEINHFHGGTVYAAHLSQDGRRIYYSATDSLDHVQYQLFVSRRIGAASQSSRKDPTAR